ncbi:MAG: lipoate--protein ligase [Bacteroidales bacterium]
MYFVIDKSTDPQWNLAAEEYLFKHLNEPLFRLWQNENAVIVGHHQNALAEINIDYVSQNGIKVVRRLTGGGAVFHDLGNVNFTFIDNRIDNEDTSSMFARFTKPIIEALEGLGVKAYLEGRNDLLIDGRKFSGNAVAVYKNRVLQHGTLLFASSMADLSQALASRPEKFTGKSVQSNRSRVTNISEHLAQPMSVESFIDYMDNFIRNNRAKDYKLYSYSSKDLFEISKLKAEKYSKEWWNFGQSPKYQFSKVEKFNGGLLEVYLNVEKGVISEIKIFGDYFFTKETAEIENLLVGTMHNYESVKSALLDIEISDYFSNISKEEFISILF